VVARAAQFNSVGKFGVSEDLTRHGLVAGILDHGDLFAFLRDDIDHARAKHPGKLVCVVAANLSEDLDLGQETVGRGGYRRRC